MIGGIPALASYFFYLAIKDIVRFEIGKARVERDAYLSLPFNNYLSFAWIEI